MGHEVFNIASNGLARELMTEAVVQDSLSAARIDVAKAIWDTGCTNSVLRRDLVKRLGLIATGKIQVLTAGGQITTEDTFVIDLILNSGRVHLFGINISEQDLDSGTEMLIGMDIISMGDFTVQNYAGNTHFSFCFPPFENKYDMMEKSKSINARELKKSNRKKL